MKSENAMKIFKTLFFSLIASSALAAGGIGVIQGDAVSFSSMVVTGNVTLSGTCTGSGCGGGGSVGGSNMQLQYNNGGSLGGIQPITWNGTNLTSTANLLISSGSSVNFATSGGTSGATITNPLGSNLQGMELNANSGVGVNKIPSTSYDLTTSSFSASSATITNLSINGTCVGCGIASVNSAGNSAIVSSVTLSASGSVSLSQLGNTIQISASGGGASSLGVNNFGVSVTTPTAQINFIGPISVTASGSTATVTLSQISLSTSVTGSLPAASIASGALGASVIASSHAVNSIYPASVIAGTYSNITLPAANVAAGSLGGSVIASSITLPSMYGSPTLNATNITNLQGAQVGSGVPAANIAAGSLGASVIASSITLPSMYGSPTLNAANITNIQGAQVGSGVAAANIAAGSLGTSVIVSSIVANATLVGSPTTTTQSVADSSTKLATTAFVQSQFPVTATNGGLGINNSAATGFVTFSAGVSTVTQICAVVATDTSTASSTNYFNAGGLVLSVAANKQYLLIGTFHFTGGGAGGSKLKVFGNGASENYDVAAWTSYNSGALSSYLSGLFSPVTDTTTDDISLQGSVNMQTLTNLNIQFAQNSSNASALVLKAGSSFCAFPIN